MKSEFALTFVTKVEAKMILDKYHYLSKISKGFKTGYNFGLLFHEKVVGVCIFTGFPVPELSVGMFGLKRTDQKGFFELSRLCLTPEIQGYEHNIASWFVARTIKELKKITNVRAILSYADSDYHGGTVYRALSFKYYGLTALKKDFYAENENGDLVKKSRGKTAKGVWLPRSRKHRFVKVFDKALTLNWKEQHYVV